ncbi:hypothetical protein [Foetidibacter luteolus]|uniref:hypothetical protein n=1 Tax=Foetidibacter luteolus TaxID=2608880 RepID=UPI00129A0D61|nr:hypothetical protein [Foetidibacter luteolus]
MKDFDFDPSTDEYIPPPPPIPPVTHYTYSYDGQGNLTSIANDVYGEQLIPHPYNNRVNILRTNKIWMFINKNYSQNGVAAAPEYDVQGDSNFNCYGLPQTISPVNFEQFIFSYGSATGSIEYMCNCNDSASK